MKTLIAVTALSLSTAFATPVFAQSAEVPPEVTAAIAACAADSSTCAAQFAALDFAAMTPEQIVAATAALHQAARSYPSLATAFNAVADAVETGTGVEASIVANFSSAT